MKLLLVNPYFGQGATQETEGGTDSPPLGLGFVGTYVRDHSDWEVEIVDPEPQGLTQEDVLRKADSADIVGLACFADTRFYCFEFGELVKKRRPECRLVIGGPHVFHMDEMILRHYPFVDILVRGEGEETMLEIMQGKPLEEIQGITFRQDDRVRRNPLRPFAKDIDRYHIDYALLPSLDLYVRDVEAPAEVKDLKSLYAIASRGCPFQCSYCATLHWQRHWRAVSPAELVRRIQGWVREYGVEYIRFYDDLFTANKRWVLEFCRLLKEAGVRIKFRVLVRAGTDHEVLKALTEVGCIAVGFGIESGSDRILRRINKGITRQQVLDTIAVCRRLDLWMIGAFILSLPDETYEDYKQSLSLVPLLDVIPMGIHIIFPYTPFYLELKERGEIGDEIWFDKKHEGRILYTRERFKSARFSFDELRWMWRYAQYHHMLRRPGRTLRRYGPVFGSLYIVIACLDVPLRGLIFRMLFRFRRGLWQVVFRRRGPKPRPAGAGRRAGTAAAAEGCE